MATVPQSRLRSDANGNYIVEDTDYPGHSVDALLQQGQVDEARAELERLILEGVDSGPGIKVTPKFWDDLRSQLRQRDQHLP
jgi:hypothetical protein